MIEFNCAACGQHFSVKDEAAGRAGTCKCCASKVRVPTSTLPTFAARETRNDASAPAATPVVPDLESLRLVPLAGAARRMLSNLVVPRPVSHRSLGPDHQLLIRAIIFRLVTYTAIGAMGTIAGTVLQFVLILFSAGFVLQSFIAGCVLLLFGGVLVVPMLFRYGRFVQESGGEGHEREIGSIVADGAFRVLAVAVGMAMSFGTAILAGVFALLFVLAGLRWIYRRRLNR